MASEHFRPPQAVPLYPSADENADHRCQDPALDAEDQVLCWLLEAFPGIPHQTLAVAYARADRDPNRAAEILSAESGPHSREAFAQTSDFEEIWKPPNPEPERLLSAEEFIRRSFCDSSRPKAIIHSDDFSSRQVDSHQLKNGHGDFAGASVWRDSPLLSGLIKPPEAEAAGSESFTVASSHADRPPNGPEENGSWVGGFPALQKIDVAKRNSRKSTQCGVRSSSKPSKVSATAGSVSNLMHRRACGPLANTINGCEGTRVLHREVELDRNGRYSQKMSKKKNGPVEGRAAGEDPSSGGRGDSMRRRAAEDFLHSMLGGDFGIDLISDVLAHYEGDTEKALETLLNIGSTSSGFDYRRNSVDAVDPLVASAADHNGHNEEITGHFADFSRDMSSGNHCNEHEKFIETLLSDGEQEDDQSHKILLCMLSETFPTVEKSSLAQVLQAAEFSYEGALQILRESGMTPVGEQIPRPKLDPAEVLRTLFKPRNNPSAEARPLHNPPPPPITTEEPWSVVVGKPRISRDSEVQAVAPKGRSHNANGQWNEYARQRTSATEHWETMKMYMKEANAAYNRGDRSRAGLLSEKGVKFKVLAQEASARASQNIFNVQNRDIANNITIDLHAQHVTEALRLLQLHLRTLTQIPSVHTLTVITGQGSHSAGGQARIKPAVTKYLDKKQVPWVQVNPGCIGIKMSDVKDIDPYQRDGESLSDCE